MDVKNINEKEYIEMLGFEQTDTGYRATDEQVAWWKARDACPACGTVVSPADAPESSHYYHECPDGEAVSWTRES